MSADTGDVPVGIDKPRSSVCEKDEVFWTELEIRRIGNLVAECIHARRYVGNDSAADTERKEMRKYIDAMKRKSMRVLHRAELHARGAQSAWPGIDPTISDPVSLAEEYVRVVESYEAVLIEEEAHARELRMKSGTIDDDVNKLATQEDELHITEDVSHGNAGSSGAHDSTTGKRQELLSDAEGVRRRRAGQASSVGGSASYSNEDEALMARHQPIQDELTSNLVDLVGQLKESITSNKDKLTKDSKVLDETEDVVESNLAGVTKQGANLKEYTKSSAVSWWIMLIAAIALFVVFAFVWVLMKIPV